MANTRPNKNIPSEQAPLVPRYMEAAEELPGCCLEP